MAIMEHEDLVLACQIFYRRSENGGTIVVDDRPEFDRLLNKYLVNIHPINRFTVFESLLHMNAVRTVALKLGS